MKGSSKKKWYGIPKDSLAIDFIGVFTQQEMLDESDDFSEDYYHIFDRRELRKLFKDCEKLLSCDRRRIKKV